MARHKHISILRKELSKKQPEKSLVVALGSRAGRAKSGRITVRHQGGGVKRLYRLVDFSQDRLGQSAKVLALEYDPYRTAFIALIEFTDKSRAYILAPHDLKPGQEIKFADQAPLQPGNRMRLKNITVGTLVHNIEFYPGSGGKLVRSAGSAAQVLAHEAKYTNLKMPSSEVRKVLTESFASIGVVSNPEHRYEEQGKAGTNRRKGVRPRVRGSAMNPVDHPHGGGEGRAPIGLKYPKTPWGKHASGVRTRRREHTDKYILERRKK